MITRRTCLLNANLVYEYDEYFATYEWNPRTAMICIENTLGEKWLNMRAILKSNAKRESD